MSLSGDHQAEYSPGTETLQVRDLVAHRFEKYGLEKNNVEWIMSNLSDTACSMLHRLDKIMPSKGYDTRGVSMMDEEIAGAIFFLENPGIVSKTLRVHGEELDRWQKVLALGTLYSDMGKVTGKGEMTWLYNSFHYRDKKADKAFEDWKHEKDPKLDKSHIESVMEMPWSEAKKMYRSFLYDGSHESVIWDTQVAELEKNLTSHGWDVVHDEKATFHDVMTRSHLISLKDAWSQVSTSIDGTLEEDVRMSALNHHLTRGLPPGDGSLWERAGILHTNDVSDKYKILTCLMVQNVDAITASLARPGRSKEKFFTNARERMENEIIDTYEKGRISLYELGTLEKNIARLPPDEPGIIRYVMSHILARPKIRR